MSSNHKAPLAAFLVVAIACIVVVATNSMRSYARDAWQSFSAPVVTGLQLIEARHEPLQPPAKPSTPITTSAAASHRVIESAKKSTSTVKPRGHHGAFEDKATGQSTDADVAAVTTAPITDPTAATTAPTTAPTTETATPTPPAYGWTSGWTSGWTPAQHQDEGRHHGWGDSHGSHGWSSSSSHSTTRTTKTVSAKASSKTTATSTAKQHGHGWNDTGSTSSPSKSSHGYGWGDDGWGGSQHGGSGGRHHGWH